MATQKRGFYLLENIDEEIRGAKLASGNQVLSVFLHRHMRMGETTKQSARMVTGQLLEQWDRARIPVKREDHIIEKVLSLHSKWQSLKKSQNRRTPRQQEAEATFKSEMANLFDIAHADAISLLKNPEDKNFLMAQREPGRRGSMVSVDNVLAKQEKAAEKRELAEAQRKARAEAEMACMSATVKIPSSESSSESDGNDDPPAKEEKLGTLKGDPSRPKRKKVQNIITPGLAAALDRTKMTDRMAPFVLAETARSLGHDPAELNISRSSIKRMRERHRQEGWEELRAAFQRHQPCIVHWDGKLLPSLLDAENVDRLPVIVTALSTADSQLLGVPQLPTGTGEHQAAAVHTLLVDWGLEGDVIGMCFDTTASNTGRLNGACVLLQQKLGRGLLSFACRHHILELILSAAFSASSGPSSGPDVQLFKRFRGQWSSLDKNSFSIGWDNDQLRPILAPVKDRVLDFAQAQLSKKFRDDYRELIELCIIFFGGELPNFTWKRPGAVHNARWMAKALYALKIWMFRGQVGGLTARETRCVESVSLFVVTTYMESWMSAADAASAPARDLRLLAALRQYHDPKIAKATASKFEGHLWYLSEELISLALFDDAVPIDEKRAIVAACQQRQGEPDPPKRITVGDQIPSLASLATSNSTKLFESLRLDMSFLEEDPSTWDSNETYKVAQGVVRNVTVVNDHAERGVALIQEFNRKHTVKEDQLQFLLGVVARHRQQFPVSSKSCLTSVQPECAE